MTRKAVALISGDLDSLLVAKLIQQQDIQVEGINFNDQEQQSHSVHVEPMHAGEINQSWVIV